MKQVRFAAGVFVAVALAAGCDPARPKLAPVRGTVNLNGKPLAEGTIAFHYGSGNPAVGAIKGGQIQDVMTFTTGDGAPVGPAKVTVSAYGPPDSTAPAPGKDQGPETMTVGRLLTPEKYRDPEKSGLTADIKPGGSDVAFDLK